MCVTFVHLVGELVCAGILKSQQTHIDLYGYKVVDECCDTGCQVESYAKAGLVAAGKCLTTATGQLALAATYLQLCLVKEAKSHIVAYTDIVAQHHHTGVRVAEAVYIAYSKV